ncbi:MAG: YceI family protein [Spirochaetes bacterium]|nr:YceI family protein [Spirochaetota bacterium]
MRLKKSYSLLLFVFALVLPAHARTYWYEIDYTRSQIGFLAKSRIINANGLFRKWLFKGKISDSFRVVGDVVIECASIDTDNERRDTHLQSADFFDCNKFPEHSFRIRSVQPDQKISTKATRFEIAGELTMHGIKQPLAITLQKDGKDNEFVLSGTAIIDREKFSITYNSALNPIEKEVRLNFKIYLIRRFDR